MGSYDVTIALGQVGTDDDLGVELVAALRGRSIEAVVAHDLPGRTLEIDMTVSAPDLATAVNAAIRATRETCERAGVPGVEVTALSASRARASRAHGGVAASHAAGVVIEDAVTV